MVFQISLFRVIFTDIWLLKKLLNGKTTSRVVKNTLSRHSKTLQLVYI